MKILRPFQQAGTFIRQLWVSRRRVLELETELLRLKAILQNLVEQVRALKAELDELREYTYREHARILKRMERLERGLPPESEDEQESSHWTM